VSKSITEQPTVNPARDAAVDAVFRASRKLPIRPTSIAADELDARDRRLAEAIHRTVMQRWLTINWLVDRHLEKPKIEPMLRAVLATAGGQLLFMDQPTHAVVDTAVEQAKRFIRAGAGKLTNAVLRRLADMVLERRETGGWEPANNLVPWGEGAIQLSRQALLKPRRMDKYLAIATSHDERLVRVWRERWGEQLTIELLLHGVSEPPTFLRTPVGYEVWQGSRDELLTQLEQPGHWVQDPTASKAVTAVAELPSPPRLIVDYCAGRGTKTRQLAAAFPYAKIVATDTDGERFESLRRGFAEHDRVTVVPPNQIDQLVGTADLLLLDVPCSNTGVLARRPEAKYRYTAKALESVMKLQREIIEASMPLLRDEGTLVYSTCSIEPVENEQQVQWLAEAFGRAVVNDELTLPGGCGADSHDGGYYAVVG